MSTVKRHLSITAMRDYTDTLLKHPMLAEYYHRSEINLNYIVTYYRTVPSAQLAQVLQFLKFNTKVHSFRIYSESLNYFDI